ncbi:hypothetical protein C1H46_020661 [Malus baccata]|uniref:Uncharacterized protein n=1 Tax=Malus baccata TaxID=106549 RepID=A0A540M4I6_MALBA|nr:hypothetical protein C1H46_020661 [Malus baccata]
MRKYILDLNCGLFTQAMKFQSGYHPTTIQPLPMYEYYRDELFIGGREYRFEIPLKLQVGETLLGLALSFVLEPSTCYSHYTDYQCILINGELRVQPYLSDCKILKATHVMVALVCLGEQEQQGDTCQVVFPLTTGSPIKSCGVHCLLRNQDELLHFSQRPTSSLGKGSSDIVDDEYDQQQQWLSTSSEDEEQEQPSNSDDPQFLIY